MELVVCYNMQLKASTSCASLVMMIRVVLIRARLRQSTSFRSHACIRGGATQGHEALHFVRSVSLTPSH